MTKKKEYREIEAQYLEIGVIIDLIKGEINAPETIHFIETQALTDEKARSQKLLEALEDSKWFINRLNRYANGGQIKLPDEFNHRVFELNKAIAQYKEGE